MNESFEILTTRRRFAQEQLECIDSRLNPQTNTLLYHAILGSDYVADSLRHPNFDLARFLILLEMDQPIEHLLSIQAQMELLELSDQLEFNRRLRYLRRVCQCLLIVRDINRIVSTSHTCLDISFAADFFIETAREWHYMQLCKKHGTPKDIAGDMVEMSVLAMGKLGGRELNLSSDIDLIFCYRCGGTTDGDRPLDHQVFFTRLGQRLIRTLDEKTVDGYVYRVDMRLRPYGDSGALVSSFDSFEAYLQTQGRPWERYAMAKARVIGRNADDEASLNELLHGFCFRRYVDFSVIDSLRDIKELIKSENKRLNRLDNVKLGVGGIREAEFIVQSFQIVRGGRDATLQSPSFLETLPKLAERKLLSAADVETLKYAYLFLRDVEHLIQAYRDEQSQTLPSDEEGRARIAMLMGFSSVDEFQLQLDRYRSFIGDLFSHTIEDHHAKTTAKLTLNQQWYEAWGGSLRLEGDFGEQVMNAFIELKTSKTYRSLSDEVSLRLDELIPRLLAACAATNDELRAFHRTWPIIMAVLRRSTYMMLLIENPQSLAGCVRLSLASPFIAAEIAKHPSLLNELINSQQLYQPPTIDQLRSELRVALMRLNWDDLEGHMEVLRYFRRAHILRVAACEVTDRLKLMKVSDYLSWLAEVILEQVVAVAWHQMVHRYGSPMDEEGELLVGDRFNVIAYGKLGGIELNYSSDLDVVFVHDTNPFLETNGVKPIDNQTFFARLGQRVLHILTTEMPSGRLYEMDTRLRPSGHSGPLVSTFTGFEKYQRHSAWVWEHQALIRARVVFGDRALTAKFNELRLSILSMPKTISELRAEVVKMRLKMQEHLGEKDAALFDLKQDRGGMVDLEFIVQFLLLANAQYHPNLARWTDNMRLIDAFITAEILTQEEGWALQNAYTVLRSKTHELALQQQPAKVASSDMNEYIRTVKELWFSKVETQLLE